MAADCVEEKKFTFFFLFCKLFIEHKKTAALPSFLSPAVSIKFSRLLLLLSRLAA